MLRLRAAIGRASRRRSLGLAVVLLLAVLLAFMVVHNAEHATEAGLACAVVALVVVVTSQPRREPKPTVVAATPLPTPPSGLVRSSRLETGFASSPPLRL